MSEILLYAITCIVSLSLILGIVSLYNLIVFGKNTSGNKTIDFVSESNLLSYYNYLLGLNRTFSLSANKAFMLILEQRNKSISIDNERIDKLIIHYLRNIDGEFFIKRNNDYIYYALDRGGATISVDDNGNILKMKVGLGNVFSNDNCEVDLSSFNFKSRFEGKEGDSGPLYILDREVIESFSSLSGV